MPKPSLTNIFDTTIFPQPIYISLHLCFRRFPRDFTIIVKEKKKKCIANNFLLHITLKHEIITMPRSHQLYEMLLLLLLLTLFMYSRKKTAIFNGCLQQP